MSETPQSPMPPAPAPPASSDSPSGPRASFGRRLVAALVDGLVFAVLFGLLFALTNQGVAYGVGILFSLAYYTYFEGSASGQTVGKRALGIRVIDFRTGAPIGYGRAFIRWIGRILSQIPCYLGYLWMLWDKEKQTWHDKLANDVVVPVGDYPVDNWPG
jgi:uncharacterized RDD family membrane protein YckC